MPRQTHTINKLPKAHAHPYMRWQGTPLWKAIDRAVTDLVGNQDVLEVEFHEYVVGYICKVVERRKKAIVAQISK